MRRIDTSTPPGQSSFTDTVYEFRSTVFGGQVVGSLSMASWHSNQGKGWVTPINGVSWGDNPEKTAPEGIKTLGVNGDGVEFDTRGADVGLENPYNTGDGGTGYPGTGGDPTQAHRCASGGLPEPCDLQSRAEQAYERIAALIIKDSTKRADERARQQAAASQRGRVDAGQNGNASSTTPPIEKPEEDPVRTGVVGFMSLPCDETDPEVICIREKRLVDASQSGERETRLTSVMPNDCEFARVVEEIAVAAPDAATFMQKLVDKTVGANNPLNVQNGQDFERASGITGHIISDSDFKAQFQDGTGYQVRHFVGGLWAGYLYGTVVGLPGMQFAEYQRSVGWKGYPTIRARPGSEPDIALNNISVPMGADLEPRAEQRLMDRVGTKTVTNVIPAHPGYKGLADQIRRRICK